MRLFFVLHLKKIMFYREDSFVMGRVATGDGKTTAGKLVRFSIAGIASSLIISCGFLPANKHSQGYTLSGREARVVETVLRNDLEVFISQKGRSIVGYDIRFVSSSYIAREYDLDPARAEQKYAEKTLRVAGKIEAVHAGDDDPPYITLEGTNLSSPHMFFDISAMEKIVSLKKDEAVDLVCECEGAVAGIPIFSGCQFIDDFAQKRIHEVKKDVGNFLAGVQPVFSDTREIVVYLLTYARLLPNQAPCFSDAESSGCNMAELLSLPLTSGDRFHGTLEKVKEELRDYGVRMP
jgi:hypothetical protein